MTAKKKITAFELNQALATSIQTTIPAAQLRKLNGEQSQAILTACAECAGKVLEQVQEANQ